MAIRPKFQTGRFYHIYNRGVEKRNIVKDNSDRLRFVNNLYEFNDSDLVMNSTFYYRNYTGPTGIVN